MKAHMRLNEVHQKLLQAIVLGSALISFTGCGKTSYNVENANAQTKAPGTYSIPFSVDFLMVEDDTGSSKESYYSISTQVKSFLSDLNKSGWDFHFANVPLTTKRAIQQVIGSQYDSNSSPWVAPYPGAVQYGPGTIRSDAFRTILNFSDFLTPSDLSSGLNGWEPGLENIRWVLKNGVGTTNFLRKDSALTVILVVGNGNDTSRVNYCTNGFGFVVPCREVGGSPCEVSNFVDNTAPEGTVRCDTQTSSLQFYQNEFKSVKSNVQFYSAVANSNSSNCLLGSSRVGTRYQQMAKALNGKSYDVCSQPISQVLSDLASTLQAQKVAYRQDYLFISEDADPSTIVVTRYVGGDTNQPVVIPRSETNGWTYEGYVKDVYAVSTLSPDGTRVYMNQSSGYAIRLHGDLVMGTDTSSVDYKAASAQSATSK